MKTLTLIVALMCACFLFHKSDAQDTLHVNADVTIGEPANPHPGDANQISGCFDQFSLQFQIDGLEAGGYLLLQFPSYIDINPQNDSFAADVSNAGMDSLVANQKNAYIYNIGTDSLAGLWSVEFSINDCDFYEDSNFVVHFTLVVGNTTQTLDMVANPILNPGNATSTSAQFNLTLNRPQVVLNKTSIPGYPSLDNSIFTLNDEVDRYYRILPSEGISDYFSLKIQVEGDADILKIEAIDTSGNSRKILFDDPARLLGNDTLEIIFYNPLSPDLDSVPLHNAPQLISTTHLVKAPIGQCSANDTLNYIYSSSGTSNYIWIHERVKIKTVNNCNDLIDAITSYKVTNYCSENYLGSGCIDNSMTLNVRSLVEKSISQGLYPYFYNGTTYDTLPKQQLTTCMVDTDATHKYKMDYVALISNSKSHPSLPEEFGIIKLERIMLEIDTANFAFDTVRFGNSTIHYITSANHLDSNYMQIIIDLNDSINQILLQSNPNIDTNGVTDRVNDFLPDTNSSQRVFQYLNTNHYIGVMFKGFHLKDCSSLDIKDCSPHRLGMFGSYQILFRSICSIKDSLDQDTLNGPGSWQAQNNFTGNTDAFADPQDVGAGLSSISHLSFSFSNTSNQSISAIDYPWQVGATKNRVLNNLISCPTRRCYAVAHMPDNGTGGLHFSIYKPMPATVIDNETQDTIATNIQPVPLAADSIDWRIDWNTDSTDVTVLFDIAIECLPTSNYGIDIVSLDFREECDTNCIDCYKTFGCASIPLQHHCLGRCDGYVSTSNFSLKRNTFGWSSRSDYESNLPPLTANSPGIKNLNRIYPCDSVLMISTNGSTGDTTGKITNLANLYFEMHYSLLSFPVNNVPSLLNFGNGEFIFVPIDTVSKDTSMHCLLLKDTLHIPINDSNVTFYKSLNLKFDTDTNYVIRIKVNLAYSNIGDVIDTCTQSSSLSNLGDLLRNYRFSVSVISNFTAADLTSATSLPVGHYKLSGIKGEFTCELTSDSILYTSCDPYISTITYLKLNNNINVGLLGSNYSTERITQCELVYQTRLIMEGGYANDDDFKNEYRPLFKLPQRLNFTLSPNLSFERANLIDEHCTGNTTLNFIRDTSIHSFISLIPDTANNACAYFSSFEKDKYPEPNLRIYLIKNCSMDEDISSIYFDSSNQVIYYPYLDQALICSNIYYPDTMSRSDLLDTFNFAATLSPPIINAYRVPTDTIKLSLEHLTPSNSSYYYLPNTWVYFTASDSNTHINLFRQGTAIPTHTVGTTQYFLTGTLTNHIIDTTQIVCTWANCDTLSINDTIVAHYGVVCKGYDYLDSIPLIQYICTENSDTMILVREPGNISIADITSSNDTLKGCNNIIIDVLVKSTGSDLNEAWLKNYLPQGIQLIDSLSYIYINLSGPHRKLPPPTLQSVAGDTISWSIIHSLTDSFSLTPPHFGLGANDTVIFHLVYQPVGFNPRPLNNSTLSFKYDAYGITACDSLVSELTQTKTIYYTDRPTPVTLTGKFYLCDGDTASLHTTTSYSSYHWSTNSTASNINILTSGTYTVTVHDGNNCILNADTFIVDNTPAGSITGNSTLACAATPNTLGLSVSCSTCTYLWSNGATTSTTSVSPLITSTFTVLVTDTVTHCSTIKSKTVTVTNPNCCGTYSTTLPSTLSSGTYSSNYNLSSTLTITGTVVFQNANIAIAPGASIIINGNGRLIINHSNLFSCGDSLWQGIRYAAPTGGASPGELTVKSHSTISNALYAVYLNYHLTDNYGIFKIDSSTFSQNYVDVYARRATNADSCHIRNSTLKCVEKLLAPKQNQHTKNHIELYYTTFDNSLHNCLKNDSLINGAGGIYIDSSSYIHSHANYFYLPRGTGIIASTYSQLKVDSMNVFEGCDAGIKIRNKVTIDARNYNEFNDCKTGIWVSENSAGTIGFHNRWNTFYKCGRSVVVTNNGSSAPLYIQSNFIKDPVSVGILCLQNHKSIIIIAHNDISLERNIPPANYNKKTGIISSWAMKSSINIEDNTILWLGRGIAADNCTRINIEANNILLPNVDNYATRCEGIAMSACRAGRIANNNIYGNSVARNDSMHSNGIHLTMEVEPMVNCNYIANTYKGINWEAMPNPGLASGINSTIVMASNVMLDNFRQVNLDQCHYGLGYQGYYDADSTCDYTEDNAWLQTSGMGYVDADLYSENLSNNFGSGFTQFNVQNSGYPYEPVIYNGWDGISGSACSQAMIASSLCTVEPSEDPRICNVPYPENYSPEKLSLSLSLASDTSAGDLTDDAIAWLQNEYLYALLNENHDLLSDAMLDSIHDVLAGTAIGEFDLFNDSLIYSIENLLSIIDTDTTSNIDSLREVKRQKNIEKNNAILAVLQSEINQKDLIAIYLNTLGNGIDTIAGDLETILRDIAEQCPYTGGPAVFAAREMLLLIDDLPGDYLEACDGISYRHMLLDKNGTVGKMSIYPNPGKDVFQVKWQISKLKNAMITITDIEGRNVYFKNIETRNGNETLNLSNLQQGIYIVKMFNNSFLINAQKLIITR